MASRYYALNRGLQKKDVAEGSSTQSKTVEIAINLADGASKQEVYLLIEEITNYILEDTWPPA